MAQAREKTNKMGSKDYEMMEIDQLIPYKHNSKVHTEEGIKALMASINQFGLDHAITVDKDMIIIGGHGRVEACKRLGMKYVKVQVRDDLSKQAANKLRISENRVTSTEYDTEQSKLELEEINLDDMEDIDIQALGFEKVELDKLFDDYNEVDEEMFTTDLDADIDRQTEQGRGDIQKADAKPVSVTAALGFKTVPIAASRSVAKFIASLQDEYSMSAEKSFLRFIEDMNEG